MERILGWTLLVILSSLTIGIFSENMSAFGQIAGPTNPNANVTTAYKVIQGANPYVPISVSTDLPSYNQGDTIVISGHIKNLQGSTAITFRIFNPGQNLVSVFQLLPSSDGSVTRTFQATGPLWTNAGTYTIVAEYGLYANTTTTFHFNGGSGVSTITQAINATYPLQSGNQIYNIPYIIKGGAVSGMNILAQQYTFETTINANADGSLTVTLPRSLIDAKATSTDISFIVTVNGKQVTQFSETTNLTVRILSIPFHNGDTTINIIGTQTGNGATPLPVPQLLPPTPPANEIDMVQGAGSSTSASCVSTNNCFTPNPISIAVGATVTWKNTDIVSHYITSGNPSDTTTGTVFDSGNLIKPRGTYQFTFANSGTYNYFCTVHPWMIGQVIVGQGGENSVSTFTPTGLSATVISPTQINLSWFAPTQNYGKIIVGYKIESTSNDVFNINSTSTSYSVINLKTGIPYTFRVSTIYSDNTTTDPSNSITVIPSMPQPSPPIPPANEIDMAKGAGASANTYCVSAKNCFSPNPLNVATGTTVTWKNTDTVSHYVTSGLPSDNATGTVFDSGNLIKPGGTYQFTFANEGAYIYFCTVHPWMIGQVIVGSADQSVPYPQSTSVFTPTQQDIQSINQARDNQTIAAEVNVGSNQAQTTSIDNNVSVQTTSNTPDSLNVNVSASSQTGPKVIAFNLNATTINVANLKDLGVMYDGKLISPAPNMDAILHAKPTDNPSFAIVVTQSGIQVLVLVPHFSTHTITLTNMSKVIPSVPEFPFTAIVLVIATFSIVLISRMNKIKI